MMQPHMEDANARMRLVPEAAQFFVNLRDERRELMPKGCFAEGVYIALLDYYENATLDLVGVGQPVTP